MCLAAVPPPPLPTSSPPPSPSSSYTTLPDRNIFLPPPLMAPDSIPVVRKVFKLRGGFFVRSCRVGLVLDLISKRKVNLLIVNTDT